MSTGTSTSLVSYLYLLASAIVVFYLLFLSWVTVFFALPSCNRFSEADRSASNVKMLKYFSVVQSYTVFAFALTLLIKATSFGTAPACNSNAVVVLLRPFSALHAGRIVCWILTIIVIVAYTLITLKDHLPSPLKRAYQRVRKITVWKPMVKEKVPDPEPAEDIDISTTTFNFSPGTPVDKHVSSILVILRNRILIPFFTV